LLFSFCSSFLNSITQLIKHFADTLIDTSAAGVERLCSALVFV